MPRSDGSPLRLYVGCIAAFFLCAFYWEYSVIARMHGPAAASARVDAVEQLEERMNAAAEAKLHAQSEALHAQLGAIKGAMAAKVTKHFSGTWQGRLGADGTWDATHAMHAGGMAHEYPGAEEKIHVVASFGSPLGGPAAGTQWMGGRFKHIVPMPAVIASAQKP